MIDKATNRDLTKGLKGHLEETEKQVSRLDQAFKLLGKEPQRVKCPAIDGLIAEADEVAGEVDDKVLGRDDVVRLLTTNLNEEKVADKKLSTVALRKGVNKKAAS